MKSRTLDPHQWRSEFRRLSLRDRREVHRAVRRGREVSRPVLARTAVLYAMRVQQGLPNRVLSALLAPFQGGWIAGVIVGLAVVYFWDATGIQDVLAATALTACALGIGIWNHRRHVSRAASAERSNRALLKRLNVDGIDE